MIFVDNKLSAICLAGGEANQRHTYMGLLQEGVMNLGLGTSAGIGEWKTEVSGHRDVT